MNICSFLLAFSPLLLLIDAATYYVNEASIATPQTGSLTNPFTSIAKATSSLGAITCKLVLLGSSASISTTLVLMPGANYLIRPDTSFTSSSAYFPINLQSGAVIQTIMATLTFQNIQLVELDPSRATSSAFIAAYSSSNITFQSVLVSDARSTDSYYYFCEAYDSFINIVDSEFRNLTNLDMFLFGTPIVVQGSRFTDLNQTTIPFIFLALYSGPNNGLSFKNNSFENIIISNTTGGGFMYSVLAHINVIFEDFYINNVTFNGEDPFLGVFAGDSSYYDTQYDQTTLTIRNGVIKNMVEKHGKALATIVSPSSSLFVTSNGPTILKVHNLSVTNCVFTNLSLISFTSGTGQFFNLWKVLPSAELTDITLKDTRNANFLFSIMDNVSISNVYLEGLSIKDVTTSYPCFRVTFGHLMNVNNVTANNVTGPLFQTIDVLAHNFSTLSLNDMYTSQAQLTAGLQSLIYFAKVNTPASKGLNPSITQDSFFDNINLNGFTSIDGIDYSKSANNSFFMIGHAISGKTYLTNSVWRNNLMNGFYTSSLPYFYVDNLTIDHDLEIPRDQIPPHKGFHLIGAEETVIKNSVFQNNQNYNLLNSYSIPRRSSQNEISEYYLTFENVTVLNNSAVFDDLDSPYFSLFIIYCPMKPVNILFHNSYFYNNTNLNGLINALENYQAKMNFTNNIFDNNYATQAAAVLSSRNMRQETSILNLTNNTFTNNRCDQNGGVFSFIFTDYNMHPVNNTYRNNTAGLAGGVGYAFRASFVFLEEQGVYSNNSAGSLGGAWYINLNTYKTNLQSLEFSQTSFVNSLAQQKGGSFYLENGGMTINQCTFRASQAVVAGGDFYISIGKSINIANTNFTASSAPEGSFLYAEEIDETLTLNNVQMSNVPSNNYLLAVSSGSLNIKDSVFENINASLFLLSSVTTSIAKTTFNQISCPKTSNSFCLLKATSSSTLALTSSSLTNLYSNVDIISLSDCTQALLSDVRAQNMLKLTSENLDQIFVLNAVNTQSLNIDKSDFTKIGFSGIKAKNTNLQIQDSTFSNSLGRLLSSQSTISDNDIYSAKLTQLIQWIILDSSNSTLTGISFTENAFNTLVNGSSVQILGSGGVHTLTDCIFENNQAYDGGALSVKGQASSISILNSQFNKNLASRNGGALTFADQSVKNTLLISQSTFSQNSATLGGAVYIGTQALIIDSSSFIENNAERGGAIATISASKNTLVDSRQSTFTSNNASEGAALIALSKMNFAYSTSSFQKNTAVYGGDMASVPTSLRLRIYHFKSYFLFIDDVTATDLLSSASTYLIYDSATADASQSVAFISGSEPNLLFEVTILDALGQKMGQTNNAYGEFKISSSSSSSLVGMLGSSTFTFTNSTAYVFKDFSVKGPFGTALTLSIQGTYFSQTSSSTQSLPSLKFPIVLNTCSVGQIYDKSSAICSSCSSNTYSIADPLTAQTCQECPDNAVCLGGSVMYPAKGYWRIDESTENLIKCSQTDSCLGGSKDGGKNISLTGFCEEGYEGVACSSCVAGSQSCVNCKESKLYYVMFGGYLLIQAIAVIFSVKMNLRGSSVGSSSSKQNSILQSTLIKIVIDFVQILTLISEFNFNFPPVVNYMYDGLSKILPTNIDALSVDCFIALQKGNNKHIFFNKVLVLLSQPLAFITFACIIWAIIYRIKRIPVFKNPAFKSNMSLTIIVIIYVLQPGIIKIMFELFKYFFRCIPNNPFVSCKNYGSSDDPKYYLVYDVNVECWKPEHLAWGLCIGIPTLLIGLLAPFGILAFWTRDKDLKTGQKIHKLYSFIFKPYKDNTLFWELAVLIRKVLLILVSVFISSQYLQAYFGFSLLGLYFYFLYKVLPYDNRHLNSAEGLSLASSAVILYSGLYFTRADYMDTVSYMLFVCDIISGLVFVLFSCYIFFRTFRETAVEIKRRLSKFGSKIFTKRISANLKLNIHSHNQLQTLALPPLESPTSLQFDNPNDMPTSSERIMLSTERIMSTERPFSPLIRIRQSDYQEDFTPTERRENSYMELPVFSPTNQTGVELFSFSLQQQRGNSIPVNLREIELPVEDSDFQEVLKDESIKSPPLSVDNKTSKILKFSKEDWTDALSKRKPSKFKK